VQSLHQKASNSQYFIGRFQWIRTQRLKFEPLPFFRNCCNLYRNNQDMKLFILSVLIIFSISANCQMDRLFFGSDWNDLSKLTDSIKTALPGCKLDSSSMTKSGKAMTLFFSDGSGSKLEASILKDNQENGKISIMQLVGSKAAVLALYRHYFNQSSPEAPTMPLQLAKLPTGQQLPIACYQDGRKPERWILASRNPY
jgi:hypothetical protein